MGIDMVVFASMHTIAHGMHVGQPMHEVPVYINY